MNKLIFKVSSSKSTDIANLLKEITKIECKIKFDLEHGIVTVENVNDNHIDMVIDLINNYYILLEVEIDNLNPNNPNESMQFSTNSVQSENTTLPLCKENTATSDENQLALENDLDNPASAVPENFVYNKISFQNTNVENALNKLAQTAYWAVYKHGETEKEVMDYIWSAVREMSIKFSPPPIIDFQIGDVVECYMGKHLPKELNGSRVLCIVANVLEDNLVYIIPLTKMTTNIAAESYLPFSIPGDITSIDSDANSDINSGTVIFDGSKYIKAERITKVVGKVVPAFMQEVLTKLSSTFDFTEKYLSLIANLESNSSANSGELVLSKIIENALNNLNPKEPISINAKRFIKELGMDTSDKLLVQSFIASYSIPKITYENICNYLKINAKSIDLSENQMALILKNTFKAWASTKPELENYQYLAFTSLLKLFIKALKKDS